MLNENDDYLDGVEAGMRMTVQCILNVLAETDRSQDVRVHIEIAERCVLKWVQGQRENRETQQRAVLVG